MRAKRKGKKGNAAKAGTESEDVDDFQRRDAAAHRTPQWTKLTPYERHFARILINKFWEADQFVRSQEHRSHIDDLLGPYERGVEDGRIDDLHFLASIAFEATRRLNKLASGHPEFVAIVGAGFRKWPVLCNGVSRLPDVDYELLLKLKIPKADEFRADQAWAFVDPSRLMVGELSTVKQWAVFLLFWLMDEYLRGENAKLQTVGVVTRVGGSGAWREMPPAEILKREGLASDKAQIAEIVTKARLLPEFSQGTCKKAWWPLASQLLDALTGGHSENIGSLADLVRTTVKVSVGDEGSHEAVMRSAIKAYIRNAFFALVGKGRGRKHKKG